MAMTLSEISDECLSGKHYACDDPMDCDCPCHEDDDAD